MGRVYAGARTAGALAGIVWMLSGSPAPAARLFGTAAGDGRAAAVRDASGSRPLRLDRGVLADLRRRSVARLEDFPLGATRTATLELTRITPFPPGARIEVVGADGTHALALADEAFFSGTVAGDPAARVLLAAGPRRVRGFVVTGGEVYPFGPDAGGQHRSYALGAADASRSTRPTPFCGNAAAPQAFTAPAPAAAPSAAAPPVAATGTRVVDVAVETDAELRAKFGSDAATLDYLSALLAAATAIYERDVGVRVQFSYVRIWAPGVTDPWNATATADALYEVQGYWNAPANGMAAIAGDRDLVHFVSGKTVFGGVAFLNVLCNQTWGFGVSQVHGAFDLSDPHGIWDVEVVVHEMGHNFGSPHTHCYVPPVDHCYASEGGCYAGPVESSQGTIMSYCHLRPGGLANISLTFGDAVSARIAQRVAAATCLATLDGPTTTTTSSTTSTSTSLAGPTSTLATTSTTAPGPTTSTLGTTTTTGPPGSTSSTTLVTTSSVRGSSTTVSTSPAATTTTVPAATDADTDGVPDGADGCAATPADDLVDGAGCSVCPCAGPREGGAWRTRGAYLRCVRAELRRRGVTDAAARRSAQRHAQHASCGRRGYTRCCTTAAGGGARCRVLRAAACAALDPEADAGAGSCLPSPCE